MLGPDPSLPMLGVTPWRVGSPVPFGIRHFSSTASEPIVFLVDRRDGVIASLRTSLLAAFSGDEVARYRSFRNPADADLFLLGRGFLRIVLGLLGGVAPGDIEIQLGPHGKPFCVAGPQFNVSHSGDLVLIALHPSFAVGVDVERDAAPTDWEPIARRVLTPALLSAIRTLPKQRQASAFLQAWCHLEAQLKLVGTGFGARSAADELLPDFRQWLLVLPQGYLGSVATGVAARVPMVLGPSG